jgi:hypothetical protein
MSVQTFKLSIAIPPLISKDKKAAKQVRLTHITAQASTKLTITLETTLETSLLVPAVKRRS